MEATTEHHLKQVVRLRRPKIAWAPSYAVILLDKGHTLRGEHSWEK
jgi:hypothetical protein